MNKTRKIGFGLSMVFGLMLTVPVVTVMQPSQAQTRQTRTRDSKMTKTRTTVETTQSMTSPSMSGPDPCVAALNDIRAAQATLTQIQALGAEIRARHAQLEANVTTSADEGAPLKCPACGMMMPTKPTGNLTRAVKYNGKTYYCCKGCDMSATADKE
jgi:hypothetical protein